MLGVGSSLSVPIGLRVGDGEVLAWGYGWYGQLGLGTTQSTNSPVLLSFPTDAGSIAYVAAGGDHSLATTGACSLGASLPRAARPCMAQCV